MSSCRSHLISLLQPKAKGLAQKNVAQLVKEGWDPRSVESLGMVDKETLRNLTRTFGRSVSAEDASDEDADSHHIFRSRSDEHVDSQNKKPQRRYVVHGTAEGKSVAGVWTTEPEHDAEQDATKQLLAGIPDDGSNFFDSPHPLASDAQRACHHGRRASDSSNHSVEEVDSAHVDHHAPGNLRGIVKLASSPLADAGSDEKISPSARFAAASNAQLPGMNANGALRLRRASAPTCTSPTEPSQRPTSPQAVGNVRSLLKGLQTVGGDLKGFMFLRSSLGAGAMSQKVFVELGSRRLQVMGGANMTNVLYKADMKSVTVSLHEERDDETSSLSSTSGHGKNIMQVTVAKKGPFYLEASDAQEAKQWSGKILLRRTPLAQQQQTSCR